MPALTLMNPHDIDVPLQAFDAGSQPELILRRGNLIWRMGLWTKKSCERSGATADDKCVAWRSSDSEDWGPFLQRLTARGSAQIALNPRSWQKYYIDGYGYFVRVFTRTFAVD